MGGIIKKDFKYKVVKNFLTNEEVLLLKIILLFNIEKIQLILILPKTKLEILIIEQTRLWIL
jgi:hypothetical protein